MQIFLFKLTLSKIHVFATNRSARYVELREFTFRSISRSKYLRKWREHPPPSPLCPPSSLSRNEEIQKQRVE